MVERPREAARRQANRRGHAAELAAALALLLRGHVILARRHRTPVGEIDIIARRGRRLAFVEVKQRPTRALCEAALTPETRRRVRRSAELWMARRPRQPRRPRPNRWSSRQSAAPSFRPRSRRNMPVKGKSRPHAYVPRPVSRQQGHQFQRGSQVDHDRWRLLQRVQQAAEDLRSRSLRRPPTDDIRDKKPEGRAARSGFFPLVSASPNPLTLPIRAWSRRYSS